MVKITGATPADKAQIKAARAVNKAEAKRKPSKLVQADETPETKATKPAKQAAAAKQFAKADAAASPARSKEDIEAEHIRVGLAVRGY